MWDYNRVTAWVYKLQSGVATEYTHGTYAASQKGVPIL